MSRSNPNEELSNPCKTWFQWDGGDGQGFKVYNKETKKNVITPLPLKFLVLDRLTTVTGYNEPEAIGYYSNEVRSLKDTLIVRSKNGIEGQGTWEEIKAKLGVKGASYCQSVYIMYYKDKQPTLGNIKMTGASLENWFTFCKANKIMEIGVSVDSTNEKKKGKVVYFEPVFKAMKITEASNNFAIEMDKELQAYLTAYLTRNATTVEQPKTEEKVAETAQNTASKADLPWEGKDEPNIQEAQIVTNADDSTDPPF